MHFSRIFSSRAFYKVCFECVKFSCHFFMLIPTISTTILNDNVLQLGNAHAYSLRYSYITSTSRISLLLHETKGEPEVEC